MKLKKRVLLFFLIVLFSLIFVQGTFAGLTSLSGTEDSYAAILTDGEKAWLKAHPVIRLAPDPEFEPIEFFDKTGNYAGLAADYARLLEQKLGIRFEIVRCANWDDVTERISRRGVDVLNAVVKNPQRETYLKFPQPYLKIPSVIIVRSNVSTRLTLDLLKGMNIVMVSGYGYVDLIRNKYPELKIELVPELKTALRKVSFGMSDAFVGDLATTSFYLESEGIANLKIAGETEPPNISGFAVRSDWPELSIILEKGMALISDGEKKAIYHKWINLEVEPGVTIREFKQLMVIVSGGILLVFLGFFLWTRMLKRMVKLRTEDLRKEIEERKRTEEALEESEEKYRSLIENAVEGFFQSTPEGRFITANDSFAKILGYESSEELLSNISNITLQYYVDPGDRIRYQQLLQEFGKVRNFEFRARRKDLSLIWVSNSTHATCDQDGKILRYEGIVKDITARREAEEALKKQTNFLNKIIESSAVSMWISDEKGTLIMANPACLEFFGATNEEVIGKYNLFKDYVIEKKGFMPVVKGVFKTGKPADFVIDYDFSTADQVNVKRATHKMIKSLFTPVMDVNGSVSNVIVQTIDLTEIKRAQDEKISLQKIAGENEKLALVGEVAGKIAHDFNNILGIIMGNAQLSLLACREVKTKRTLELIYEQTIRGRNLTRNLVVFAKDQEPKQEFFRINEKIDMVLNLLRKDLEG